MHLKIACNGTASVQGNEAIEAITTSLDYIAGSTEQTLGSCVKFVQISCNMQAQHAGRYLKAMSWVNNATSRSTLLCVR